MHDERMVSLPSQREVRCSVAETAMQAGTRREETIMFRIATDVIPVDGLLSFGTAGKGCGSKMTPMRRLRFGLHF
jgi:hypothetical protein